MQRGARGLFSSASRFSPETVPSRIQVDTTNPGEVLAPIAPMSLVNALARHRGPLAESMSEKYARRGAPLSRNTEEGVDRERTPAEITRFAEAIAADVVLTYAARHEAARATYEARYPQGARTLRNANSIVDATTTTPNYTLPGIAQGAGVQEGARSAHREVVFRRAEPERMQSALGDLARMTRKPGPQPAGGAQQAVQRSPFVRADGTPSPVEHTEREQQAYVRRRRG